MGRGGKRRGIALSVGRMLLICAWAVSAHLPGFLLGRVTRPALMALHQLTARAAFPVAELLAFGAMLLVLAALAGALFHAIRERRLAPILRWLRGLGHSALAVACALAVLWLPAMVQPVEAPPVPTPGQLEWLCGALIDALNASSLSFPEPAESLRLAPAAAGLPNAAVKAARYPEWMRAASVSGLFVPLTGEALADATVPAPLIPFTAVHELMHLDGVADEGAANIAAWDRCLEAGGSFADAARLWALRYAMGLLYRVDEEAWACARGKMKDPLARVYMDCGGEALAGAPRASRFPRLSLQRGDYAALARWLASGRQECRPMTHAP